MSNVVFDKIVLEFSYPSNILLVGTSLFILLPTLPPAAIQYYIGHTICLCAQRFWFLFHSYGPVSVVFFGGGGMLTVLNISSRSCWFAAPTITVLSPGFRSTSLPVPP